MSEDVRSRQPGDAGWTERLPALSWRVIVAGIVVVLLITGATLLLFPRGEAWQSRATLLIDQPLAIAVSQDPGVIDKLARLRFKYAGIVETDEFTSFVSERSDVATEDLEDSEILAEVPPDSLLLFVGARGERDVVQMLASDAADALIEFVEEEHDEANVPDRERFFFELVSPADEPEEVDPSRSGIALTLLTAGVILAVAAVVIGRRS